MKTTYSLGDTVEMGIDEVGRGCFWGPLTAGAVIWAPEDDWTDEVRELVPNIRDSKKISKAARSTIAAGIKGLAVDWGVGFVSANEIDERGMTWANRDAFQRAIAACESGLEPELLLIDGILGLPDYGIRYECIVGGDDEYVSIAAASILAKDSRDCWVKAWSAKNGATAERYDLLSNMGYGTIKHRNALKEFGAHELHRKQFIRNWI
jgi:ribonuclease HII